MLAAGASMITRDAGPTDRGTIVPSGYQEPNYGGVTCTVVRENAAGYKAGLLEHAMCEKMEEHVGQCVICSDLLSQNHPSFGDHVMVALAMKIRP
jgi:hypothetical protein